MSASTKTTGIAMTTRIISTQPFMGRAGRVVRGFRSDLWGGELAGEKPYCVGECGQHRGRVVQLSARDRFGAQAGGNSHQPPSGDADAVGKRDGTAGRLTVVGVAGQDVGQFGEELGESELAFWRHGAGQQVGGDPWHLFVHRAERAHQFGCLLSHGSFGLGRFRVFPAGGHATSRLQRMA
jgi:hypothetical protein